MPKISEAGFLTELSARAGFCPNSAEVYGSGMQGVVALSSGGNVYKAYTVTSTQCGIQSAQKEARVLALIGGHEGEYLRTPHLKSHIVFDTPFTWNDREFVSAVEQSFMPGTSPSFVVEPTQIGKTLAELHVLMAERLRDDCITMAKIPQERMEWIEAGGYLKAHFPAALRQLRRAVDRLLSSSALTPVHGDFIDANVRASFGNKYGVLDFARVGLSVPEQDMLQYAAMPTVLAEVFKAYAEGSGYTPSKNNVRTLYAVDLALKAELACKARDGGRARDCATLLEHCLR